MSALFDRIRHGGYYSRVMFVIAAIIAAPALAIPFYPKEAAELPAFLLPALAIFALGVVLTLLSGFERKTEKRVWHSPMQRGSVPVLFVWLGAMLSGSLPFIISGYIDPLRAIFESVAGWTTTGLTVTDFTQLPHIFIFYRALMRYCGGLGFIILIAIVFHGKQMTNIYSAEGHQDRLMPNLRRTSVTIALIYTGCLALGIVLLNISGMPVFDAICHAMSAISTSGLTERPEGVLAYDNLSIELVTIALMLIGSINFAFLLLIVKRNFRRVAKISELRFMLCIIAVFIPLMVLTLIHNHGMGFFEGVRHGIFSVVTMVTTTGYSIADYAAWPPFAIGLMMILMLLGGGTGSTSGGIKMLRGYIILRVTKDNIRRRLSPGHSVRALRYTRAQGSEEISDNTIRDTFEFATVFTAILVVGTLLISLFENCPLGTAAFEFLSALSTTGVTNGLTLDASAPTLVTMLLGMVMGRLEIYILFIGLHTLIMRGVGLFRREG